MTQSTLNHKTNHKNILSGPIKTLYPYLIMLMKCVRHAFPLPSEVCKAIIPTHNSDSIICK